MFSDIHRTSASRITEVRDFLDFISPLFPSAPVAPPRHLNTSKGLIFVQLYGVIEYTVSKSVESAILEINAQTPRLLELNPPVWGLALNAELDALIQVNKRKWDKRTELWHKILNNQNVTIDTNLMPTTGENFTSDQLASIWKTFLIVEPMFPKPEFRGRLQEIVTNRINIAHGNVSAADVGSAVTINDLNIRIQEVSEFCTYFCNVFEEYATKKLYLKSLYP